MSYFWGCLIFLCSWHRCKVQSDVRPIVPRSGQEYTHQPGARCTSSIPFDLNKTNNLRNRQAHDRPAKYLQLHIAVHHKPHFLTNKHSERPPKPRPPPHTDHTDRPHAPPQPARPRTGGWLKTGRHDNNRPPPADLGIDQIPCTHDLGDHRLPRPVPRLSSSGVENLDGDARRGAVRVGIRQEQVANPRGSPGRPWFVQTGRRSRGGVRKFRLEGHIF